MQSTIANAAAKDRTGFENILHKMIDQVLVGSSQNKTVLTDFKSFIGTISNSCLRQELMENYHKALSTINSSMMLQQHKLIAIRMILKQMGLPKVNEVLSITEMNDSTFLINYRWAKKILSFN